MHILVTKLKYVEALFLCFCVGVLFGCIQGSNPTLEAGTAAPDFSFMVEGQEKHLSDYRGKKVILHFWASWCENCKEELPVLASLHEKLQNHAIILSFGVMEDPAVFRRFAEHQKLPFLYSVPLSDKIVSLYKLTGVPESFVLDKDGNFIMLRDPQSGLATVRVLGPLAWDSPGVISQLVSNDS